MFSIAYRMTGSVTEAEDLVQEAFFRLERARQSGVVVESPKAYLAATTTRLAIDHLRSARVRRESYVGTWLPEPIVADLHDSPEQMAELSDSLSMAFLVLLESLSPVERAVFLLREVFDYPYEDIAQIVDKSEANCRQIFGRARQHLGAHHARYEASTEQSEALLRSFLVAARDGDLDQLVDLLAADVVFYGDGGGKATAIRQPLYGRDRVATFVIALFEAGAPTGGNGRTGTRQRRTWDHHPRPRGQDRQRAFPRGPRRRDPDGARHRQPRQAPAPRRRLRHGSSPNTRTRRSALNRHVHFIPNR